MITEYEKLKIETNIPSNQVITFSFEVGRKSFKTLISNLYTDKIKAVITELCANAYDSHVAAGNPETPFEVTLPSQLEPLFVVRDFGTGMSHDFMKTGYVTAFNSSKEKSNDYNGEKGLGRLSALSVCDSYTCHSIQNGIQNSYSVFYNTEGVPSMIHLGEVKTSEKDGFIVEIPVDASLCYHFCNTARKVFLPYTIKPIVFGNSNYVHFEETPVFSGKAWTLFGAGRSPAARCSVYEYPINPSSIIGIEQKYIDLLNSGLVIYFNIGQINTAANREALEYDKHTIENIKNALVDAYIDIGNEITNQFKDKTLFEQILIKNSIFSYDGSFAKISNLVNGFFKANSVPDHLKWDGVIFNSARNNYSYTGYSLGGNSINFIPRKETVFIILDKKTAIRKKVAKLLDSGSVIQPSYICFVSEIESGKIKEFADHYGLDCSKWQKSSDLPYDKIAGSRSRRDKNQLYTINKAVSFRRNSDIWQVKDYTDYENVYYVTRIGTAIEEDKTIIKNRINYLNSLDVKPDSYAIVGLTSSEREKLDKEGIEIDSFESFYLDCAAEFLEKNKTDIILALSHEQVKSCHVYHEFKNFFYYEKEIRLLNENFADLIKEYTDQGKAFNKLHTFLQDMPYSKKAELQNEIPKDNVTKYVAAMKNFPILRLIGTNMYNVLSNTSDREILFNLMFEK